MPETTDRVVAFLYLLLRDKLPAGDVDQLVANATTELGPGPVRLVHPQLAAMAVDYAERLREASRVPVVEIVDSTRDGFTFSAVAAIGSDQIEDWNRVNAFARHLHTYDAVRATWPHISELIWLASTCYADVLKRASRQPETYGERLAAAMILDFNRRGLAFTTAESLEIQTFARGLFAGPSAT